MNMGTNIAGMIDTTNTGRGSESIGTKYSAHRADSHRRRKAGCAPGVANVHVEDGVVALPTDSPERRS